MSLIETIRKYPFNSALTFLGAIGFALIVYGAIVG